MKFYNFRIFAVAVCFLFGACLCIVAQSKSKNKAEQSPLLIKANVLVLDAAQQPVDNLKAEDFKVFEDGVEQKIRSFAFKEPAFNVGFVMDNSGSLRPDFEKIIKIGKILTANLRADDRAFVVRFVSADKIEVVQDWTSDKQSLNKAFDDMFIEGGLSAVVDALYLSNEKIATLAAAEKTRRHALVVVTDGDERDSFYKLSQLLAQTKTADVQIFFLTPPGNSKRKVAERAEQLVRRIALETGGEAFILNDFNHDAIIAALQSLVVELRSQYVLGYASTNPKRDGQTRKLIVQIADGSGGAKREAIIRGNVVVPKE